MEIYENDTESIYHQEILYLEKTVKQYIPEFAKQVYRFIRAWFLSIGLARSGEFPQPEEEIEASRDFSVIVAIHDSLQVTSRCLRSLERYGAYAEIIIVDDSSRLQETIDLIRGYQQRNNWKIIRHENPLGHSRSCEAGSQLTTRPYLCLLNSDTFVTPWSWSGAKEAFESDPKIAVTGPTTSWAATSQKVIKAMHCRHYWTDEQICSFAKNYISDKAHQGRIRLPSVSGFAFFIRRELWMQLGGFDVNLPDYGNEIELCDRLSRLGYYMVWTQNSYIHHFGRGSYSRIMNKNEFDAIQNNAIVYIENLSNKREHK